MQVQPQTIRSLIGVIALVGLTALACPGARAAVEPRGVAQVIDLVGTATVRTSGGQTTRALLLHRLRPGDVVSTAVKAAVDIIFLGDGKTFRVQPASRVVIRTNTLELRGGPAPQPMSALGPMVRQGGDGRRIQATRVRSGGSFAPRNLSPNQAVRQGPVMLTWQGPISGKSLELYIADGRGWSHRQMLKSTERQVSLPADLLKPGVLYHWSLTTDDEAGGHIVGAPLRILTEDERIGLEALELRVEEIRLQFPKDIGARLVLAEMYERVCLVKDCRESYQALMALRPNDPILKKKFEKIDDTWRILTEE